MPSRNLGERKSLICDSETGFDQQGYVVTSTEEPDADIRKATTADDHVLGVNYVSTRGHGRFGQQEVRTGIEAAIIHDGYPNVLAAEGHNYEGGDAVYVADHAEDGLVSPDADPAGDGSVEPTKVGNVVPGADEDLTAADGPTLIQVDLTSNLGES